MPRARARKICRQCEPPADKPEKKEMNDCKLCLPSPVLYARGGQPARKICKFREKKETARGKSS